MIWSISRWIRQHAVAHRAVAIAVTIVIGLGIGVYLNYLSQPSSKPRPVQTLIRLLQKRDTAFHLFYQFIWASLPEGVRKHAIFLEPRSAVEWRRSAALELRSLGAGAKPAIPFLIKAVDDVDRSVSIEAIGALQELGPLAKEAVPALYRYFTDPAHDVLQFQSVRMEVADALVSIAPDDPKVLNALLDTVNRHLDPSVRARIVHAVSTIKPPPRVVIQIVTDLLRFPDPTIQEAAIDAAGQFAGSGADTVPTLIELYDDLKSRIARQEPESPPLKLVWSSTPPTLPLPGGVVADGTPSPGQATSSTIPPLIAVVNPGWGNGLRSKAQLKILEALGRIGPTAQTALPLLERESTNSLGELGQQAVFAKWQIDHDTNAAIRGFGASLSESNSVEVYCLVVGHLAQVGPEAIPALTAALSHREFAVRFTAIKALESLGPQATSALAQLRALAQTDPKLGIRSAAKAALTNIR
jgi:HEAT repeat protein